MGLKDDWPCTLQAADAIAKEFSPRCSLHDEQSSCFECLLKSPPGTDKTFLPCAAQILLLFMGGDIRIEGVISETGGVTDSARCRLGGLHESFSFTFLSMLYELSYEFVASYVSEQVRSTSPPEFKSKKLRSRLQNQIIISFS
jgi:hypothetical protein